MKKFIPLLFILVISCGQPTMAENKNISYQDVNGYIFSSNSDKPNNFYLVINDEKTFNEKFGEAPFLFTKGNITKVDFSKELVLSVVKYGEKYWEIKGNNISVSNKKLTFSYIATLTNDNMTWTAAIPYLVKINKTDISEVIFEENGKVIETISIDKK